MREFTRPIVRDDFLATRDVAISYRLNEPFRMGEECIRLWLSICGSSLAHFFFSPSPVCGGEQKAVLARGAIVYSTVAGVALTMDYYAPKGKGPHPVAIILHGGGFVAGDSRGASELYCADFLTPAGYAVFSINYRLAPKYPYPAMIEDVQAAIRYVRLHAARYDVAPEKIALVGESAGGYLSNMVGVLNEGSRPHAGAAQDRESARANAVVTLFGITDFEALAVTEHHRLFLAPLIQEEGLLSAQREASPINHVTKDAPPFFQIIGDKDEYFPVSQVERFDAALRGAGVSSRFLIIPDGMHGTNDWHAVAHPPDWEREMVLWLDEVLRYEGPVGEGIREREPASDAH